ncbi:MAG: hypothetical protein M3P85_02040 [Actinomycetota bacterium]|nr:hypothetical protein [Actinomycetota bacterium]
MIPGDTYIRINAAVSEARATGQRYRHAREELRRDSRFSDEHKATLVQEVV